MVKWSDSWLERSDKNNISIRLWAEKKDLTHARCRLCDSLLKYSVQGFQCLIQHSEKSRHKELSDARFGPNNYSLLLESTAAPGKKERVIVTLDPSLRDKVSAAEATWLFKVAESDFSFRDSDNTPLLFRKMFSDPEVCKHFTMGRDKASYLFQEGIGPLLTEYLCSAIKKSECCYTLIFDETTTVQNQKQMDLLIRYWDEDLNEVVTSYLGSLFFGRADAKDVTEMILNELTKYDLPWMRLFSISVDGPNINKSIYRNLNKSLRDKSCNGLIELITCTLHIVHNAFRKCVTSLEYGDMVDQFAFDLYKWFDCAPCKVEDFRDLADSLSQKTEALFVKHVNTRWLTLSKSLTVILLRWDDCVKYFIEFLPTQKETRSFLAKNPRFDRIRRCLTVLKSEVLLTIKFLLDQAPIFEVYLTTFQTSDPCIHNLFPQMKRLLVTLMKRFIQPDVVDSKTANGLIELDVSDPAIQLVKMDFGEVGVVLRGMDIDKRRRSIHNMKEAYISVTKYLQKKLPLGSSVLKDATCLAPSARLNENSIEAIGRLASSIPHIISEREVSIVRDEWRMYQAEDVADPGKTIRIDHYWRDILNREMEDGSKKFVYLSKVTKSILSLSNGNADVERSLSLNKGTLTDDRNRLSQKALMGVRRAKEFAHRCGGAHNVDTLTKGMVRAVQQAHRRFEERKKREQEEMESLRKKKKEMDELEKQHAESILKAQKSKEKLDKKEENLKSQEDSLNEEYKVAQRLMEDARRQIDLSIEKNDMIGVKVAREMLLTAEKRLEKATINRSELQKKSDKIGDKRKCAFQKLMDSAKRSKDK